MKNVCIPLGSQFRIKYVRENVFIFLPQTNIKKKVCFLLGNIILLSTDWMFSNIF